MLKQLLYILPRFLFNRREIKTPLNKASITRILVLRYDGIGDLIVTTPMFSIIKRHMPRTVIDVVCSSRNVQLVADDDRVENTFVFDKTFIGFLRVWRQCKKQHYSCVISLVLNKTTLAGFCANLFGGRKAVTVSFMYKARAALYRTWFNIQIDVERDQRTMAAMQTELACRLFGLDADPAAEPLKLCLSNVHNEFADNVLEHEHGKKIIAVNICAGNPYRSWSLERNRELLHVLLDGHPEFTIFLITDSSREAMAQVLSAVDKERVKIVPVTSDFRNIVAFLKSALIVITPDTAMVHAAASVGTPVLVMYSLKASFLTEWMPHGVPYEAVKTDGVKDLETIQPGQVMSAFNRLLNSIKPVS